LPIPPFVGTACRLWAALATTSSFGEGGESPSLHQPKGAVKMAQQNDFDFNAFNNLTERKPAGLQIFLAQQLLSNALWSMEKFDNPRGSDVSSIVTDIKVLRELLKQDTAARASK